MASFGVGPNLANYGSRGRSPSLAAYGQDQMAEADRDLAGVAKEESQRNAFNTQAKAAAKQGNMALGSTLGGLAGYALGSGGGAAVAGAAGAGASAAAGAEAGSAIGPWGTLIGGVVGALAGAFFS